MMDYQSLFAARESCRKYQTTPVEMDKLQRMVESAVNAPSACNSQPWHFTVVTQPELLPTMRKTVQLMEGINKFASDCPCFIVVSEVPARVIDGKGGMCFNQKWAQIDLGLVTMQLTLAATAEGLGSCIMGVFDEVALKASLPLPADSTVRMVVAVGYPVHPTARPKARRAMEQSITYVK